jgi:death-on-curing protein
MIVEDLIFPTPGEVIKIHRDRIERYGGDSGLRDIGFLQSAMAMPAAGFGGRYLHTDLFKMAASYLFHITQNHPFHRWEQANRSDGE